MAEEKKEKPTDKELKQSKTASIDFPVVVESIKDDPYHPDGEKFLMGEKKAKELERKGWVKIKSEPIKDTKELLKVQKGLSAAIATCLLFLLSFVSFGQTSVLLDLKNPLSPYATSDTVVNTATAYLTSDRVAGPAQTVTVQVVCTEISGTTAGTITLQGSINGTNFVALTDSTTVPNITTKTATDVASQSFTWQVTNSPYLYYRVSWTGSGTMSNKFSAKIMKH